MASKNKNPFFRVMDAAVNRAAEGLRVAEDFARLHLNDRFLTESLKQVRHSVVENASKILPENAVLARDTLGDVGCFIETDSEYLRGDSGEAMSNELQETAVVDHTGLLAIVRANMKRAQQALRTLEECAKAPGFSDDVSSDGSSTTRFGVIAKSFESLRYTSYTIEKAICASLFAINAIADRSIYVLIDGIDLSELFPPQTCGQDLSIDDTVWAAAEDLAFTNAVRGLIEAKVDFIQLRDKKLSDRQLITAATLIRRLVEGTSTRLIVNDRPDIARIAQAHGVHVGQEELTVADVRQIVGPGMLVGVSTHSVEQAKRAVMEGASYIGIGPVFPSTTKSFDDHVGVGLVREVVEAVSIPAFAIGGIDLSNANLVADAGCRRIAVSGVFKELYREHPSSMIKTCQQLRECLN